MLRRLRPRPEPVPARLYTRAGCLLCDELVAHLERAGLLRELALEPVDVDAARDLKKRYGLRIPVLELAGEEVFEGRPEPDALRAAVRAALPAARRRARAAARSRDPETPRGPEPPRGPA